MYYVTQAKTYRCAKYQCSYSYGSMTRRNSVDQETDQEPDQCNELPLDHDDATIEVIINAVNVYSYTDIHTDYWQYDCYSCVGNYFGS